jgi:hypothetical protein
VNFRADMRVNGDVLNSATHVHVASSSIPPPMCMWRRPQFRHPHFLQTPEASQKGGVLRELRKKEV